MNQYIKNIIETFDFNNINELKNSTIVNASQKAGDLTAKLLNANGNNSSKIEDNYDIDSDALETYMNTLKNPKQKQRLMTLYQKKLLVPMLLRKKHVLSTIAHSNLGWFSEHNIQLSPEFYNSEGSNYGLTKKHEERKPTEKESKFYRYFSSMGADTVGMTDEEKKEFHKIVRQYWLDTTGVDPFDLFQ